MTIINDILYLSSDELEGFEIPAKTVHDSCARNRQRHGVGSWQHIKDPDNSHLLLINVDTIPQQTQDKIITSICKQEQISTISNLKQYLTGVYNEVNNHKNLNKLGHIINGYITQEVKEFYLSQRLNSEQSTKLTQCIALLDFCADHRSKKAIASLDLTGVNSRATLYEECIKLLKKLENDYLNTNIDRFSRKINEYIKLLPTRNKALKMVAGKRISLRGNTNNKKVTEAIEYFILNLYLFFDETNNKPGSIKLLPPDIHLEYERKRLRGDFVVNQDTGELQPMPEIGLSTIKNIIYKNPILANVRHGSKWLNDRFRFHLLQKPPKYSLTMISMDDMDSSFPVLHKNKEVRPKLYFIFDVASEYIIAWHLAPVYKSKHDTPMKNLIRSVAQKAIYNTGYKIPLEWQMEKHATAELKGTIESNFANVQAFEKTAIVNDWQASPQGKKAEGYLNRFQTAYERKESAWKGQGVATRKQDSRPNPDIKQKTYDPQQLHALYSDLVSEWNNGEYRKGKPLTRKEKYLTNQNPEAIQISEREYARIWGYHTTTTMGNHKGSNRGYVSVSYKGEDLHFVIDEYWTLLGKVTNQGKVKVYLNPYNLEKCWLFEYDSAEPDNIEKHRFLCECDSWQKIQTSIKESTAEDKANYQRGKDVQRGFNDWVSTELEEIKQHKAISSESEYDLLEEDPEFVMSGPYNKKKHDSARQQMERSNDIELYGGNTNENEVLDD